MHLQQSINLDQTAIMARRNTNGVADGGTGTGFVNTLRFNGIGSTTGPMFSAEVTTAAGGTVVALMTAGLYAVTLGWSQSHASNVIWGMSLGLDAADGAVAPSFSVPGMLAVMPIVEAAGSGGGQLSGTLTRTVAIDMSRATRGSDREIRFHAWNAAIGGRPVGMLAEDDVWFQVQYIQPLYV